MAKLIPFETMVSMEQAIHMHNHVMEAMYSFREVTGPKEMFRWFLYNEDNMKDVIAYIQDPDSFATPLMVDLTEAFKEGMELIDNHLANF